MAQVNAPVDKAEADKKASEEYRKSLYLPAEESALVVMSEKEDKVQPQKGRRIYKKNPLLTHVPSDETDLEIMEINNQNGPWRANTCMLQKTHKHYGSHCEGGKQSGPV